MSNRVQTYVNIGNQITTLTTTILIGPVDVRGYRSYGLCIQNGNSAVGTIGIRVQVAMESSADYNGGGTSGAPNWVDVPSGTIPNLTPGGPILASATLMTSSIANQAAWLRIMGGYSATAVSNIRLMILGRE